MGNGPNRPNRPMRPRGGPGGRKRRVVIEGGNARGRDGRAARDRSGQTPQPRAPQQPPATGPVTVESGVTVKDLSRALGVPMPQIIKTLMGLGQMRTATQSLSDEEVELIATEVGREVTIKHTEDEDLEPTTFDDDEADLSARPPVRDDHGARRPRQDDAAGRDPRDRRGRHGGGRDHAAHRRVPDGDQRSPDHVPRHARVTRRSPPCVRAARRSRTSPSWSSPPTTA